MKDSSSATERVGRYQLLEPIGGGPNGSVARAKVFGVAGFERQFAVKRFLPELTVGALAQSLSQAARSYGSLEHPRIARMSEFGVAQGQTFTAVEYVAGLDVFRLLQEAKLAGVAIASGGALALVSQAARAVGYAHGRGLSHLGLSPTNVIVTADGDVKVTDFGILAATMPQRPVESPRLASRVPYLAPEQISGEATSAASDVFVLGVIAYELVTGQRAYRGETPAQIAQAILAGPPAEPPLPRPIVRVLQRCLARSPFERFPDARALADALDAALRVAPVPGTRKDVGSQVKTTLERYAALNEGNVSGMVALNLTTPVSDVALEGATVPFGGRPEARTEPSPMPVMNQSAASTVRDMPKPFTTMPGLAPPPIPVPPGVSPPPSTTPLVPGSTSTIPGMSVLKKPSIPSIGPPKKPSGFPAPDAAAAALGAAPSLQSPTIPTSLASVSNDAAFELSDDDGAMGKEDQKTILGLDAPGPRGAAPSPPPRPARPTPGHSFESTTGEMTAQQIDALNRRATLATSEVPPVIRLDSEVGLEAKSVALHDVNSMVTIAHTADTVAAFAADAKRVTAGLPEPEEPPASFVAPPPPMPLARPRASQPAMPIPNPMPMPMPAPVVPAAPGQSTRLPMIAGIVLAVGVLGAGGYVVYNELIKQKPRAAVVAGAGSAIDKGSAVETGSANDKGSAVAINNGSTGPGSAAAGSGSAVDAGSGSAVGSGSAAGSAAGSDDTGSANAGSAGVAGSADTGSGSAALVATAIDAGTAAVVDKPPDVAKPTASSDSLQVKSKPAGARVFIDGADQGVTPIKVPGSADRHTIAVLSPGHDLYLAEIDGKGVYDVALKPVTPNGGHAGIKVTKCKDKERYYVFVDGAPTGMTCPTERIDTVIGPHVVEIYDLVTETRRKFDIVVKDERLSVRVKIDN